MTLINSTSNKLITG